MAGARPPGDGAHLQHDGAPLRRNRATLGRSQRLGKAAVAAVLVGGLNRSRGAFRLQYIANGLPIARLAQIVPKRFAARAVDRNRVRRIVREVFRLRQQKWSGYDCVFRLRAAFDPAKPIADVLAALLDPGP